ncbi:MAG: ThuA domain-containing protein, partial [Pirellula sp.]|nr:ThuA domain-containing protein [Pirellula sp.]
DSQAKAVLDFIASGKGFVPLHCATYCWRNSPEMVQLMGGQFQRHGGQVFSTEIAAPDHPIMKGFSGFSSWDETYIHHLHNEKDRTVLEYRSEGEQAEGNQREPWSWVRTHGQGRVFYTAWGHDERTWSNPGFANLIERGIRWACKDDPAKAGPYQDATRFDLPEMTTIAKDLPKFEYIDVGPKIPNYTPGARWGVQGEPKNEMQLPLGVEDSMKHFVTPKGMTVRRYADERDFQSKPVAMTWDERGRLWICETVDYPNELGTQRDRIRICEDTDGDHVADKFTVFAEGLSIPTAIVIVRGGAVVQDGRETVYLKDTNGDDKADTRTVLLTGWAMGDTHGGVSNFRYGLDNWIWAMQGYNYSSPKIDGKETQSFAQGFWRFKLSQTDPPRVTDLEFIRSSDNNTWGLGISEEGLIFGSTANRNPSMFVTIPNRYYERVRGWAPDTLHSIADTHLFKPITDKVRQVDQFGGYTAGCGHALYTARTFPKQWWNRTAFVCGPTGHLVGTFILKREGANYSSSNPFNLLASDDEWSAPIMAEIGPDGAVWVIDWYNYIVQHNPTPHGFTTGKGAAYESDLRDKKRGRIYRVVPTTGEKDIVHEFASLAKASNLDLVKALRHPSFPWRLQAQRLLIERGATDVLEPLVALLDDSSVDEAGINAGAIHALHTLQGLGVVNLQGNQANRVAEEFRKALKHPSPGVRRNAIAILPQDEAGLKLLLENKALFKDSDAQVRLQALLTLADSPSSDEAGALVAELASQESDPVLIEALTSAAAMHSVPFLKQVLSGESVKSSDATVTITQRVAEHVGRGRPDADSLKSVLSALNKAPANVTEAFLDGLIRGLPAGFSVTGSESLDQAFVSAFQHADEASKVKLIRLASQCNSEALQSYAEEIVSTLIAILENAEAEGKDRADAARNLIAFRAKDDAAVSTVIDQINPQMPPALATQFYEAVRRSGSDRAGELILESLPTLTPQIKNAAISAILSKPEWTKSMLDAVEAKQFDLSDLSLDQKQSLRSFPDAAMKEQAEKLLAMGGGLPDENREKVLQSLMHVTKATGDVEAGIVVYKRVCAQCHKHGDMGKAIGPELTGMAVHPKEELLTHIIDPSRNVEGNFRLYNLMTVDGQVVNGMLAGETRTTVTIIDSQAKEISVSRDEIEQLVATRKSVMPEGFESQMTEKELTDLLEFLTNKGKFIPVPLDKYATAVSTKSLFTDGNNGPDRMIFDDWGPKIFKGVPFVLTDPKGQTTNNIILLNGPFGSLPPKMPKSVMLACNTSAKAIHMLSGVGGWSFPYDQNKSVSVIVRLQYADGEVEDHELKNGVHFADYISRNDVPGSEFAFRLRGQQIRYLSVQPKREEVIKSIELVKGKDNTAPIVMAITIER